jgi:cytochrome c oxidase subunit I+III
VFGYLFLWTIAPNWPPEEMIGAGGPALPAAVLALMLAAFAAARARAMNAKGRARDRELWQIVAGMASLAAAAGLAVIVWLAVPDPTSHGYAAATTAMLAYSAIHALIGVLFSGYAWARGRKGWVSAARAVDARAPAIWHAYSAATGLLGLGLVFLLPHGLPA